MQYQIDHGSSLAHRRVRGPDHYWKLETVACRRNTPLLRWQLERTNDDAAFARFSSLPLELRQEMGFTFNFGKAQCGLSETGAHWAGLEGSAKSLDVWMCGLWP